MRKLIYFIIIITLTTCTPRHKGTNVERELYPIYTEFLKDCEDHGINIDDYPRLSNLKKKVMSEDVVGICITDEVFTYKYRNVYINDEITDKFLLKFIAYHEMGHCIFGLGHDEGEEIRLMTPEINLLNRDMYEKHWDELRYIYFKKIRETQNEPMTGELNCKVIKE